VSTSDAKKTKKICPPKKARPGRPSARSKSQHGPPEGQAGAEDAEGTRYGGKGRAGLFAGNAEARAKVSGGLTAFGHPPCPQDQSRPPVGRNTASLTAFPARSVSSAQHSAQHRMPGTAGPGTLQASRAGPGRFRRSRRARRVRTARRALPARRSGNSALPSSVWDANARRPAPEPAATTHVPVPEVGLRRNLNEIAA
jgi:hypothetical protein